MIRAVLDTNVLVSAFLGAGLPDNIPHTIWLAWRARRFELFISDSIRLELRRTMAKPFVLRRTTAETRLLYRRALQEATNVRIIRPIPHLATHPEDDLILAAALSAQVDYLVTGDRQLLALGKVDSVAILTPRAFVQLLSR